MLLILDKISNILRDLLIKFFILPVIAEIRENNKIRKLNSICLLSKKIIGIIFCKVNNKKISIHGLDRVSGINHEWLGAMANFSKIEKKNKTLISKKVLKHKILKNLLIKIIDLMAWIKK